MNLLHDNSGRNEAKDPSLEEMDSKMSNLARQAPPPDPAFQERLKARLLEARAAQRMSPSFSFRRLWAAFAPRSMAVAVGALVLIAVLVTQLLPFGGGRGTISRLLISDVSAAEFDLVPTEADAAGSAPDAAYLLTSKTVDVSADAIKASLAVAPAVPVGVEKVGKRQWRIAPKEPLSPNTIFKVTLAAEAADGASTTSRDFEWAFQVKDGFKVLTSIPRDRATAVPTSIGIELTFSHEGVKDIAKYFSIEPSVEGRFETHGRTVVFVPKSLVAGTLYTVRVAKGLGLEGSPETLPEDYLIRFETESVERRNETFFQMSRDTYEFANGEIPTVQINRSGPATDRIDAKVYRFASPEAFLSSLRERDRLPVWTTARTRYLADVSKLEQARAFSAAPEQAQYLEYIRFPEALPRGFYLVELTVGDLKDQAWIQIGDAAAYIQVTTTDTLVWVNSLATKEPVSNAEVRIGELMPARRTGANGIAVFPTPQELLKEPGESAGVQYLRVSAGPDTVFVPVLNRNSDPAFTEAESYWRYLSIDRPLYQTTDTLRFWGVIKRRADGKPIAGDLTISLRKEGWVDFNYRPTRILEQTVTADAQGAISGELALKNLKPDYYTLELRSGETVLASRWLNVSPYTKPAYQLAITTDREAFFTGEAVKVDVSAAFFDGTPVPNLALAVSVDGGGASQAKELVTDASGKASFMHTETYADCGGEYECWPRSLWLTVRPQQAELAEITAMTSVRVFGPRSYVTSKTSYPAPGRARAEFKVRQINMADVLSSQSSYVWEEDRMGKEPVPNAALDVEVVREWYEKTKTGEAYDFIEKTVRPTYRYDHKSEVVERFEAKADNAGSYVYERDVEPERSYKIIVKARDGENRTSRTTAMLWHYDGRTTWEGGPDESYDYWYVKLDDRPQGYGLGETVEASLVRNGRLPQVESGKRFLFMQLQRGLQEYAVSDEPVYRFPFEARDVPNINLGGVHFNGKTYVGGDAWWAFSAYVPFKRSERALTIDVKPNKPAYAPGEEARLDVRVTDANGTPVAASVNLNVIDEAYYAVASESVDPLAELYAGVSSGSLYASSSHLPPVSQSGGAEKGCFLAGTRILMADGTTKPIEEVRVGDQIMTLVDPATAGKAAGRVSKTFRHVVQEWLTINGHLKVTPEHLLYSNQAFRQAGDVKVGDWLLGADGRKVVITSIETHKETVPVFNFTVEPYHTYIAEGLYVHNDKGGGGVRQLFVDSALFRTLTTGRDGRAEAHFTLPDNLTSWRVTAQATSGNLYAGTSVSKIPVSLPAFLEPTIGKSYLVGDRAIAKLRAYGAALTTSDQATFEVTAPSLGLASGPLKGKAFVPTDVALPAMTAGRHDVTYKLSTPKGRDTVLLPIEGIASRLQRTVITDSGTLAAGTSLKGEGEEPLTVVLSDVGQNRYYWPLQRLASTWTDRLDQAVARPLARDLLKTWYGEELPAVPFESNLYQTPDGGLALLPYAASGVEMSARVVALAPDRFDRVALAQYFSSKLEVRNPQGLQAGSGVFSTPEEVTWALYGLSALDQPVLNRLQAWEKREDLGLSERLAVAESYAALGAGERARALLIGLLEKHGRAQGPYAWLEFENDSQDARSDLSARAAVLAARLGLAEHEALWTYAKAHPPRERLLDLEEVAYIRNILPRVKPSPAKVAYKIGDRRFETQLTGGRSLAFSVSPQEIGSVTFESVEGSVAYAVRTLRPASLSEGQSQQVSITREYLVNGTPTTRFKDGDLIEVRLTPRIDPRAPGREYQITDLLPSGLAPVTSVAAYGASDQCASWRPYAANDQRVTFRWSSWNFSVCGGKLTYYARVATKGEYRAEPALIQGLDNVEAFGFSPEQAVTIE